MPYRTATEHTEKGGSELYFQIGFLSFILLVWSTRANGRHRWCTNDRGGDPRTRALFNLPTEYTFVYIEIRIGHIGTPWATQRVPVINGAALVDFWARIPSAGGEANIQLRVRFSLDVAVI